MARNFSPLATGAPLQLGFYIDPKSGKKLRRYMPRLEKISGFINHHVVGSIDSLQRELLSTSRTLSVHYGFAVDGTAHPNVAEHFKANTTSVYADHSHVTAEWANESLAPEYRISDATFDTAARINADVAREYGFVPSAATIRFHRQFVKTECPGPYLWDRRDDFIALVREYYYATGSTPEQVNEEGEETMNWKDRYLLQLIAESQGRVEARMLGQSDALERLNAAVADLAAELGEQPAS